MSSTWALKMMDCISVWLRMAWAAHRPLLASSLYQRVSLVVWTWIPFLFISVCLFLFHDAHLLSLGISSRGKLPSIYRPLSPDKVLREQPPVRPGAAGAMLPLDCSELPGQILPAEAPIILSLPRTGKADNYELTWRPRHERGVPVLEYMVKYRKVRLFIHPFTAFFVTMYEP